MQQHKKFLIKGCCIFLFILFFALVTQNTAFADTPSSDVFNKFRTLVTNGSIASSLLSYGKGLFKVLFAAQLIWNLTQLHLDGKWDLQAIFLLILRQIIVGGIFYYLLTHAIGGNSIFVKIVDGFKNGGMRIAGISGNFSPLTVIKKGINLIFDMWTIVFKDTEFYEIIDAVVNAVKLIIPTAFILYSFIQIAMIAAVTYLRAMATSCILVYFLGFGGSDFTRDIAIASFKTVFMAAVELFTVILLVGVSNEIFTSLSSAMAAVDGTECFKLAFEIAVASWLMQGLISSLPSMISGVITGAAQHSNGANAAMGQQLASLASGVATAATGAAIMGTAVAGKTGAGYLHEKLAGKFLSGGNNEVSSDNGIGIGYNKVKTTAGKIDTFLSKGAGGLADTAKGIGRFGTDIGKRLMQGQSIGSAIAGATSTTSHNAKEYLAHGIFGKSTKKDEQQDDLLTNSISQGTVMNTSDNTNIENVDTQQAAKENVANTDSGTPDIDNEAIPDVGVDLRDITDHCKDEDIEQQDISATTSRNNETRQKMQGTHNLHNVQNLNNEQDVNNPQNVLETQKQGNTENQQDVQNVQGVHNMNILQDNAGHKIDEAPHKNSVISKEAKQEQNENFQEGIFHGVKEVDEKLQNVMSNKRKNPSTVITEKDGENGFSRAREDISNKPVNEAEYDMETNSFEDSTIANETVRVSNGNSSKVISGDLHDVDNSVLKGKFITSENLTNEVTEQKVGNHSKTVENASDGLADEVEYEVDERLLGNSSDVKGMEQIQDRDFQETTSNNLQKNDEGTQKGSVNTSKEKSTTVDKEPFSYGISCDAHEVDEGTLKEASEPQQTKKTVEGEVGINDSSASLDNASASFTNKTAHEVEEGTPNTQSQARENAATIESEGAVNVSYYSSKNETETLNSEASQEVDENFLNGASKNMEKTDNLEAETKKETNTTGDTQENRQETTEPTQRIEAMAEQAMNNKKSNNDKRGNDS